MMSFRNYYVSILINASLTLHRIRPSEDWIESQIPEVVKNGVKGLGEQMDDIYEIDAEALVQAYVNILVGACISLGNPFALLNIRDCYDICFLFCSH